MISLQEAKQILAEHKVSDWGITKVSIHEAQGRYLAEDVYADRDYPPFNRAAMDGYAMAFDQSIGTVSYVVKATVTAGQDFTSPLQKGECVKIMTGAKVPAGLDVVVKSEDTVLVDKAVKVESSSYGVFTNIAKQGEDATQGECLLKKGTYIDANVLNVMAVVGSAEVEVFNTPKIVVVTTGDELVDVAGVPAPFQIRNSNGIAVKSMLSQVGFDEVTVMHVVDTKALLASTFESALEEYDIVISTGGVSMGDKDFVPATYKALGVEELFHKVKLKPGKPIWCGRKGEKMVFGLPGNPLSAQVGCRLFVLDYIYGLFGAENRVAHRKLSEAFTKKAHLSFFFPVVQDENGVKVSSFNGSGDITSTLDVAGFVLFEAGKAKYEQGDIVDFYSL